MTVVGGVVQPDYASCSDGPVGGFIEVPGPVGPTGPTGPTGPQGPQAEVRFPFMFVFGDGVEAPQVGAKVALPVPIAASFRAWQIRVAGDVTATAQFAVRVTATPTGALASVGGTQPAIAAVKGARATTVDWTTTAIVEGGIVEAEYVSGDALGVTLMVEYSE